MNSKNVLLFTIIVIIGIIAIPTGYKIYKKHNKDLITVVENEFLFYANKCFNEDNCSKIVYLKDLYDNYYLFDKLTNPINKRYYAEESYINLDTKEIKLIS